MFAPYTLVPTATVPPTFLSFNFDWNLNGTKNDAWTDASFGWTLDLQNPRLRALAKALSPANLRIGGSDADSAVYSEAFPGGTACPPDVIAKHVCLTPSRWDEVVEFANDTGLRIAFTLNMMAGRCGKPSCGHTGSGPWDPSNAKALLTYTAKKHPDFSQHGFELGTIATLSRFAALSCPSRSPPKGSLVQATSSSSSSRRSRPPPRSRSCAAWSTPYGRTPRAARASSGPTSTRGRTGCIRCWRCSSRTTSMRSPTTCTRGMDARSTCPR